MQAQQAQMQQQQQAQQQQQQAQQPPANPAMPNQSMTPQQQAMMQQLMGGQGNAGGTGQSATPTGLPQGEGYNPNAGGMSPAVGNPAVNNRETVNGTDYTGRQTP
jgi:hypothetical protein